MTVRFACSRKSRRGGRIARTAQTLLDWTGHTRNDLLGGAKFQGLLTIGSKIYYETHYAPLLRMQGFANEIALDRCSTGSRSSTRPIAGATSASCCWQGEKRNRSRRTRPTANS